MLPSNKGFILADSLVCLYILMFITTLVFSYLSINYQGKMIYQNYLEKQNSKLVEIFNDETCAKRACDVSDDFSINDSIDPDSNIDIND